MISSEQDPLPTLIFTAASSQQTDICTKNDQQPNFVGSAYDQENVATKRRKLNRCEDESDNTSEVIKEPIGEEKLLETISIKEVNDKKLVVETDCKILSEIELSLEKSKYCDSSLSHSNSSEGVTKCPTSKNESKPKEKALEISLVPEKRDILSDYNLMLTENVQFYEVSKSYSITHGAFGISIDGLPTSKVGLRCIHCPSYGQHVTAASFFPSSITSIASGLGTIGARHFIGGKCPHAPSEMLESLRQNKKTSQQQTRMQGRIGLDAYCRELAKRKSIRNLEFGGIQLGSEMVEATSISSAKRKVKTRQTRQSVTKKEQHVEKDRSIQFDRNDVSAFVEGSVEHFWECKHCISLPHHWKASGSVVFSAGTPTLDMVKKHLENCQGKNPLRIPRNAKIYTKENEGGQSVMIQWENQDKRRRKSGRIHRRSVVAAAESAKKNRSNSTITRNDNENFENETLIFPEDKLLTTDFAHFTFLQLKKCHLTKAGGSRGNCPLGYPGLACRHCATTASPRRFFYTSADHLRNSFSHIPSHLATCSKCPDYVKQKVEELKAKRSMQKSQLKVGDHKKFIDRVWDRLHGSDGGIIDVLQNDNRLPNGDVSDEDSISSISMEAQPDYHSYQRLSIKGLWLESDHMPIEPTPSDLVFTEDRKEVVDYTYYSMLQMVPKLLDTDSDKTKISDTLDVQFEKKQSDCLNQSDSKTSQNLTNEDSDASFLSGEKLEEKATNVVKDGNPFKKYDDGHVENEKKHAVNLELSSLSRSQNGMKVDSNVSSRIDDIDINNTAKTAENPIKRDETATDMFTIVCKFCNGEYGPGDYFLPKSNDELRKGFPNIPQHLLSCKKCPHKVKENLRVFKSMRATQEAFLKRNAQNNFMDTIWCRLKKHFTEPVAPKQASVQTRNEIATDLIPYDISRPLLTEDDRHLVTQFTFFTMEQMKPCLLEKSGNGSRSMFQYGFPGLSCIHCADTPSARKFFYRTSDILSGNYAHIPNHVLSCKHCPQHVKKILAEKKKVHADEKLRLHRGSQRIFFSNVWERLHCRR